MIIVLVALVSLGCTTTRTVAGSALRDASASEVTTCEDLGEVVGESGMGGMGAWASEGELEARNRAANAAAALGGTHLVWGKIRTAPFSSAVARVFRCPTT